jgi:hypothetical protein
VNEYLVFNIPKVKQLRDDYEAAMEAIKENLPNINLNSKKEIISFFEKTFQIKLESSKIKDITKALRYFDSDSEEYDLILGVIYFYKMKYMVKNYLNCILKHHVDGVVQLREYFGLALPNRQRLPYSEEVIDCIEGGSEAAILIINTNHRRNLQYGKNTIPEVIRHKSRDINQEEWLLCFW